MWKPAVFTKDCPDTCGLLAKVDDGIHWMQFMDRGKGINQLTSQCLTDQGETCAFHCNRVEVMP